MSELEYFRITITAKGKRQSVDTIWRSKVCYWFFNLQLPTVVFLQILWVKPQTWIIIFAVFFLFYTNRSWLNWNQLPLCSGRGPTNDKSDETCVGQGRTQTLPDDATSLLSCSGWWIQRIHRFTWDTIRWALVSPLLFLGCWSFSAASGNRPPLRPPTPRCVVYVVYNFTEHAWVLISKIQGNTSYSREYVILSCSESYNYTDSCRKIVYGFLNTPRSQGFFPLFKKPWESQRQGKAPWGRVWDRVFLLVLFSFDWVLFLADTKNSQNFALGLFAFNQGLTPQFLLSFCHFLSNKRLSVSF